MNTTTADHNHPTTSADPTPEPNPEERVLGPLGLLGLTFWCGLLGGFIEVVLLVAVPNSAGPLWDMFGKSRHYTWMIPVSNTALFLIALVPALLLTLFRRKWGATVGCYLLGTLAFIPPLLAGFTNFYAVAIVLLSMGIASRLVPLLRRRSIVVGWIVKLTAPLVLIGLVGSIWWSAGRGRWPGHGEAKGVAPEAPNVLLVVLDTVRADSLELYDSNRETMPNLTKLARSGIVFDQARSTAPWTLPSHASLFTGRCPTELSTGWYRPLEDNIPTLAEELATHGFDTGGFVGNTNYCSYFSGLDRGFGTYVDIPLTPLRAFLTTEMGNHLLDNADVLHRRFRPQTIPESFKALKPSASEVTDNLLDWIDHRSEPDRPFFAFVNYFDAHDPYILPEGVPYELGGQPKTDLEWSVLRNWWREPFKIRMPPEILTLGIDAYHSCIRYIDNQLRNLFDQLDQRGLLDNTIIIVTADHGELLGEQGLFGHGISLYEPEIHTPLILLVPETEERVTPGLRVDVPVSLRDLPATILDLLEIENNTIPGHSLVPLCRDSGDNQVESSRSPALSSLKSRSMFMPVNIPVQPPIMIGPMNSLVDDRLYKYIRTKKSQTGEYLEQLYSLDRDPREQSDRATEFAMGENLRRLDRIMSEALERSEPPEHHSGAP